MSAAVIGCRVNVRSIRAVVDALENIPLMRDDYQRRVVLDLLPVRIRSGIADSTIPRVHLVAIVRGCEQHPAGRQALVEALRLVLGEDSPDFRHFDGVVRAHW